MSTENVTIIIKNGETKVRQHGRWNGIPTAMLTAICDTLNKHLDALDKNVLRCKLVDENKVERLNEANETFKKIKEYGRQTGPKRRWDFESMKEWVDYLSEAFDRKDVQTYILQSDDTGYSIAEVIATCDFEGDLILPDCDCDSTCAGIDLVCTIDLDNQALIADWLGTICEWDFDELPTYDELERLEDEEES